MDADCDGKLTYQDFINLKDMAKSETTAPIKHFPSSLDSNLDPFIAMAKDVEQRREYDLMEWNDEIQGSKQQKKFKMNHLTKGAFSPREFSGSHYFESKISFLNQQCHGLPTGFTSDEKKALKRKIVGGNMYGVLHNQYLGDAIEEA